MSERKLSIAIGTDNFKTLVNSNRFVDKTLFIEEVIDSGCKATLITRPPGWGTTLGLDMLRAFLSVEIDEYGDVVSENSNKKLFEKLRVANSTVWLRNLDGAREARTMDEHQGKWPVIFVSFKDVMGDSYEEVEKKLKITIQKVFSEYLYLRNSKKLGDYKIIEFQKYVSGDISKYALHLSLLFLSELLYKHHGKDVYILVDDYDNPVNYFLEGGITGSQQELIQEVAQLITNILSACGKDNHYLEKIILTGIFDSIIRGFGSGFNNLCFGGIEDINFSRSFGFSEDEVTELIRQFGFKKEISNIVRTNVKAWYKGYNVPIIDGNISAYTPRSVMNYLSAAYEQHQYRPKSYWLQNGPSTILQILLKDVCINNKLSKKLSSMIETGSVTLEFDTVTSLFRYDLTTARVDEHIFSYLLLNLGYFTVSREYYKGIFDTPNFIFNIPNFEVRQEFARVIKRQALLVREKGTNICTKMLDDIYQTQYAQTIKAIKFGDVQNLRTTLTSSDKCEGDNLAFSYFHVAAMYGNIDIFEVLKNHCGLQLLNSDDVYGLKPKDYSDMFNTSLSIGLSEGYSSSLSKPGLIKKLVCSEFKYSMGLSFVAATTTGIGFFGLGDLSHKWAVAFVIGGGATAFGYSYSKKIEQILIGNFCSSYEKYHGVDISDIDKITSPQQIAKYHLDTDNTYASVDGKCAEGDNKINSFSFDAFKRNFPGDEELSFTLCGVVHSNEEGS